MEKEEIERFRYLDKNGSVRFVEEIYRMKEELIEIILKIAKNHIEFSKEFINLIDVRVHKLKWQETWQVDERDFNKLGEAIDRFLSREQEILK